MIKDILVEVPLILTQFYSPPILIGDRGSTVVKAL